MRRAVAFMLDHAGTKVLIGDTEFGSVLKQALKLAKVKPLLIDYRDLQCGVEGERLGNLDYEDFIADGDPDYHWAMPSDEWNAISLNYTSGTTGNPKGVVYHHRGAALMCYANTIATGMGQHPVYLWTLPMFHCNGWCFPWSISARLRHACLPPLGARQADVRRDRRSQGDASLRRALRHVGAAQRGRRRSGAPSTSASPSTTRRRPPPAAVLAKMDEAGLRAHPSLRADRDLRPGDDERVARGLGRAPRGGAARQAHPPGRALSRARGSDRDAPRDDGEGRRPTARPWARSCSAAIS